jgi:hypothetical protein
MLSFSQTWASASSPFIYLKPTYPGLIRLKYMVHIYLYKNRITVKSPVKAAVYIWLTRVRKFGFLGIFPYFLYTLINKLVTYEY